MVVRTNARVCLLQCCFITINVLFFTLLVWPPFDKEERFLWRLIEAHVFSLSLSLSLSSYCPFEAIIVLTFKSFFPNCLSVAK